VSLYKKVVIQLSKDLLTQAQVVGEIKSSPSRRPLVDLSGWSATKGLRQGPYFFRQQCGILGNGSNPDPAMSHGW